MTRRPRSTQARIVSRDEHGQECLLVVVAESQGVTISDDDMLRTMTPAATVALIMALLDALGSHVPVRPGPISGSF